MLDFIFTYIVQERNKRISSGEISLGRPICPVSTTVVDQTGVHHKEVWGRVMPLDTIRQQHIQQMEKLKLLRNSDSMILQKEDCLSILKERSS